MKIRLLAICLGFCSCSPKIVSYLNEKAAFNRFETYHLVNVKIGESELTPEAKQLVSLIESQINFQMADLRNYQASKVSPDLILRYELVSNTNAQVNQNNPNPFFFNQFPTTSVQIVYESVILLELLHNKKLVWQGSYDLRQSRKEERITKTFKDAINLIFTTYPYKASSSEPHPSLTSKKKK